MTSRSKYNDVSIITLGCSKNTVDSEVLMRQLQYGGINVNHNPEEVNAGKVIINTCGFINDAKEESIETILKFANIRREGKISKLIVMGCLSQRYRKELQTEIPEVDHFFGVDELPQILATVGVNYRKELIGERLLTTPSHYAYLKISEGCNRKCAFCAIPLIRGKHHSKTIGEIVSETKFLAAKGVKELMIIAQDTTYYGLDIYGKKKLPELIEKLTEVDGIEWIRLHYAYPAGFPSGLIDVMKSSSKICHYLDIPVQHISDKLLKSMHRGHTGKQTRRLLEQLRKQIPDIAIRTSIIVGFPGETKADFEELKNFVKETKFDRLGIFTYSHEENTAAFKLTDNVQTSVKKNRADILMQLQEEISLQLNRAKTGKVIKTIIDRKEGDFWIGRSQYDSPEVDNEILIPGSYSLNPGNFYQIKITSAEAFDLFGVPV
ncbi:MAG TPA: 30S ribosomal protein S12 methylthiotransferase RimO [Bacteroidales bacterium]|nr:30S ribosomal protein S12 methylthiotransferase RimO [Bacteroidales bacterium]HPR57048.1 30S ribosomal protein S12 methylthiotransferase RimO [Bacteroidales bacterium]HRW96319.1 30S ribosomal protein S12 methylthiotransferase RimO [Bacteroidales bacterium]